MKFSSILKKINFKSRKSMLKTGAILFWSDMKRLFNWNMDNFKSNFLSRGHLGSKSNDKFFLPVLKMWQCCKYFFGNLIFTLTAWTLSGNRLKLITCKTNTIDNNNKKNSNKTNNSRVTTTEGWHVTGQVRLREQLHLRHGFKSKGVITVVLI